MTRTTTSLHCSWFAVRPAFGALVITSLTAGSTAAQSVPNPRVVEFSPSAHHASVVAGQAAVTQYELEIYAAGAVAPFHRVDLGKPAPESDGKIRYNFSTGVSSWPLPGGTYEARVAAIGPGGTEGSAVSNTFTLGGVTGCSYALAKTNSDVNWPGGTVTIAVTAPYGCSWAVSTSATWITVVTPNGIGNGTAIFTTTPNTNYIPRTATVSVAGQSVLVLQTEQPASYPAAPQHLKAVKTK